MGLLTDETKFDNRRRICRLPLVTAECTLVCSVCRFLSIPDPTRSYGPHGNACCLPCHPYFNSWFRNLALCTFPGRFTFEINARGL